MLKRSVTMALSLGGIWLLWSGIYQPLTLSLGAASCLGVVLVARRMGIVDAEADPAALVPRVVTFVPWLLLEIVRSNIDVARRILSPSMPIHPTLFHVDSSQRTELGRVLYANSITLTPGTVSVDLEGKRITVHALTKEGAEGVASGEMDRRVSAVEDPA